MRCQSCGKEIADKAIICYRCGAPTAIPERTEPRPSTGQGSGGAELVLVLLVVLLTIVGAGVLYWQEAPPWTYAAVGGAGGAAFVWLRLRRRPGPPG